MQQKQQQRQIQRRKYGEYFEKIAAQYLTERGLRFITKNFSCRQGEIDLIFSDTDCLVFVEVKYRKTTDYGGAIAAIPYSKQRKLRYTAQYYMVRHGINENYTPCRFDVIAIEGTIDNIQWIQNAF